MIGDEMKRRYFVLTAEADQIQREINAWLLCMPEAAGMRNTTRREMFDAANTTQVWSRRRRDRQESQGVDTLG